MTALAKNIMIGIFVIIAVAIIVFILLFLHPAVGDNAETLHVRFTDIDKVNVGTRVTYAGKPVGEVVDIKEIPEARTDRLSHEGAIYVYDLTLKVDSGVKVYNTDDISIRTSGLLGEKNVAITPQPLKPGETLYLINNEIIYATPSGSVEDAVKQFSDLSRKIGGVMDNVNKILDDFGRQEILTKLSITLQNTADITTALNQPDKWNQTLTNIWALSSRVNDSWTTIDHAFQNLDHLVSRAQNSWLTVDQTLHNFYTFSGQLTTSWASVDDFLLNARLAAANARDFTDQIKQVINYASSGQGTIGRLFVGDDLYLRLKSVLHKGQTIADDVSHFGLLFHLNKDWQRLNARRMKLLQRLATPEQFTAYFDREIDKINSSLSSVSMVLNETACYPQSLLNNPDFTHRFSELIKRVEEVEDSLKMYNEQVVDQECYQD